MKYSVIVPAYNEEENVVTLHREIVAVMEKLGEEYEIIFVNDGSTDATLERLKTLSPIRIINFRKNFGQTAALDAGFRHARGEIFITMDADLQNDPRDIPKLLKKLAQGLDVVSGWRVERKDSWGKRFASRGADYLRKYWINDAIHDSGCTLKAYRAECFANGHTRLYGEMHRFIPGILKWQGFRVGEVKVRHRARKHGRSKYDWKRILKAFVDMVNVWFWRKYSNRPIHIFGGLGMILILTGSAGLLALLFLRAFRVISLAGRVGPLIAVLFILVGVQLFVSGLLADIAMKTYFADSTASPYSIKEIIEKD
jgi:glycosyltransferase involved in cell wall biosynthesis